MPVRALYPRQPSLRARSLIPGRALVRVSWNVPLICTLSMTKATLNVSLKIPGGALIIWAHCIAAILQGDCRGPPKGVFTATLRVWYCRSREAEMESEAHRGCVAFPRAHWKEWMRAGCTSLTAKLLLSSIFSSLPSSGNLCQRQSHCDMQEFYLLNVSSQTQHPPHWAPCLGCSVCCGGNSCSLCIRQFSLPGRLGVPLMNGVLVAFT